MPVEQPNYPRKGVKPWKKAKFKPDVNSLRDQMKRGKAFDNKRREKMDKRREGVERRQKSENDRCEN